MNVNDEAMESTIGSPKVFYGWYLVGVSMISGAFQTGVGIWGVSVFVSPMEDELGWSRTSFMLALTIRTALTGLLSPAVGPWRDTKNGPRVLMLVGSIIMGTSLIALKYVDNLWQFYLFFGVFGSIGALGSGGILTQTILPKWFIRRRGKALGIASMGGGMGPLFFPIGILALVTWLGWRDAWFVLGMLALVLLVPMSFLVKTRPEDMGLLPDGRGQPIPDTARRADAVSQEADSGSETPVLRSLHFWLLALPMATPGLVSTALVFHQTSIFKEAGLTPTLAAGVFVIFSVSAAITSMIGGFVVERASPKRLYGFATLMLLVTLLVAVVINSTFVAVLYVLIMGVANGAQHIVQGVIWAHYYGRHRLGRIQGPAMMMGICGSAVGPFPLALLHDVTGSYSFGLLVMTSLPVLSLISVFFAHPTPFSSSHE